VTGAGAAANNNRLLPLGFSHVARLFTAAAIAGLRLCRYSIAAMLML